MYHTTTTQEAVMRKLQLLLAVMLVLSLLPVSTQSQNLYRIPPYSENSKFLNQIIVGDTLANGARRDSNVTYVLQRGGVYLPSPLVDGDHLYTINNNGIMTAYEARTGKQLYQQRIEGGNSFTSSPVAAGGHIYAASEDGDVFVIKAGPQFEQVAKNAIGEAILATPAFAGDLLLVRGATHLFAIAERQR